MRNTTLLVLVLLALLTLPIGAEEVEEPPQPQDQQPPFHLLIANDDGVDAKGIKATADQTLRDIAHNNGQDRPFEILRILGDNEHQ